MGHLYNFYRIKLTEEGKLIEGGNSITLSRQFQNTLYMESNEYEWLRK